MGCKGGVCSRNKAPAQKTGGCSGGSCSRKNGAGQNTVTSASGQGGISTVTPQQAALLKTLTSLGLGSAQEMYPRFMGDPQASFDPLAQQAMQGFEKQSIPTLAERFTSMRAGPQQDSFMNLLSSGKAGLTADLGAQRAQYGLDMTGQQQNFLSTLLGQSMKRQFEPVYKQRGPSGWSQVGGALMSAAPMFMGMGGR